jgi:glyoxylase-like metal-dependent hydrolase (beta-lactamase superfamily II)
VNRETDAQETRTKTGRPLKHWHDGVLDVSCFVVGRLDNNVYCMDDGSGGAIVVDPSDDIETIFELVGERSVSAILVTHGHFDHVGVLAQLRDATHAPVYSSHIDADRIECPRRGLMGEEAPACIVDKPLSDGDQIKVGALTIRTMLTPGHTEGGMCYILDASDYASVHHSLMFSGDTLFCGAYGRTDLAGGDQSAMQHSLRRLSRLPRDTRVLPGHGASTTIGEEKGRVLPH